MHKKTVVITGGNRGIGLSITEAFVDADYSVFVGARQEYGLGKRFGDKVTFFTTDVRKESDHQNLVKRAVDKTGRLDVFINNAGYSEWRPIAVIDEAFLDDILATNLKGAFWGCKTAVSAMIEGGSIINISSIASKRGSANNSAYVATKFAMNGLTQSLAKEVGPRGIRVNGVCPVLIPTDGLLEALKSPYGPAANGDGQAFISKFALENAALKRLPTGAEVAAMCVFLASEASSAITAQNINVDCGVFPQ
ncbi:SDR family oxidoreductase [Chlorobium phaeovibrioides]|uniref:SDR family NAD(P)-dependent oxidoreductase n=1 Tax=Chlorobium phaeovibrioides TaxID=1094 RepID=UPI000F849E5A|nr:SDR family oxidoreductase [Chlorobium phaeovibrioides]RTY34211.1 SDR family oxidoreductase [Chlorobium phaeovibrioides]